MVIFKWDGDICVCKVKEQGETSIQVELYRGSINGIWNPIMRNEESIQRFIQREDIVDKFMLTKNNKLPGDIKDKIKALLN